MNMNMLMAKKHGYYEECPLLKMKQLLQEEINIGEEEEEEESVLKETAKYLGGSGNDRGTKNGFESMVEITNAYKVLPQQQEQQQQATATALPGVQLLAVTPRLFSRSGSCYCC
jgi:hypothetical protein